MSEDNKPGPAAPETPPKAGRFLGSLRDALAAAGREDQPPAGIDISRTVKVETVKGLAPPLPATFEKPAAAAAYEPSPAAAPGTPPSAAEAARVARTPPPLPDRHIETDAPTTRVVRASSKGGDDPARTQLVRGKQQVRRDRFHQDPVVGWLVIVGGPGLGSYRPIFEGNNTIGRSAGQRVPIDFGDETISSEEQAYIRYDSVDRTFLFVPNLAKTNVVQVNEKKPTAAVPLGPMDVITMGRTQLVFVPFCGQDFDWSEIGEVKA
jgi:hypothetical protein